MSLCTYMRLVAMQIWPVLRKAAQNSCSATCSTSTSGMTMAASLPPSSSVTRLSDVAALAMTLRPVAVEPVKLILSMPGWLVIQGPRSSPPETMFSTPSGSTPRSSSPILSVVSGVKGEGFSTRVFPASRAGATLNMARMMGKFHGAMAPTTPMGTWRVSPRRSAVSSTTVVGMSRPEMAWHQ